MLQAAPCGSSDSPRRRYRRKATAPRLTRRRRRPEPELVARSFGVDPPIVPWIAGYALECGTSRAARSRIEMNGLATRHLADGRFVTVAPPPLGGILTFGLIGRALPVLA